MSDAADRTPVNMPVEPPQTATASELVLAQFLQRWRLGERPTIEQFAPDATGGDRAGVLQALVRAEQFKTERSEWEPGTTVGDYEIVRPIGEGGLARVYLARQRSLGRLVALKVSDNVNDEGRTLASLEHDHIVLERADWQGLPQFRSLHPAQRAELQEDVTELLLVRVLDALDSTGNTAATGDVWQHVQDLMKRVPPARDNGSIGSERAGLV